MLYIKFKKFRNFNKANIIKIIYFFKYIIYFLKKICFIHSNSKEEVKKTLKIRLTRKLKGLSHESMAIMLDISASAYNKLERNETTLSFERLLSITDILEIPLSEMLEIKTGDTLH